MSHLKPCIRIYIFLVFIVFKSISFGQENSPLYIHSFSNAIGITLEGGFTLTNSDFNNNKFDYLGRGMLEYFFYSNNIGTFGLRLFGGLSYLGGKGGINPAYRGIESLKTSVYYIAGGYSYTISASNIFHPYIFAGLSYLQFYPRDNNSERISQHEYINKDINYIGEIGLRALIHDNFSLNVSGTANINPSDNLDGIYANGNNDIFYSGNIGISYYFLHAKDSDGDGVDDSEDLCPETPPHLRVDEFGCPRDSDKDGVPDDQDICPNTQRFVVVDKNGCPVDLDNDGVLDHQDSCLYTPIGIEVDDNGCPTDLDKDGIPNYLDHCPQTPMGYLVDSLGCPDIIYDSTFNKVIINKFRFSEDELPIGGEEVLQMLYNYMVEHESFNWSIEGHSDSISVDFENNYGVSVSRAKTVYNYFLNKGIDKNKLSYSGFSHIRPVATNELEMGRKLNRRVEIIKLRQ